MNFIHYIQLLGAIGLLLVTRLQTVNSIDIHMEFVSTNTTAKYNEASKTYDVAPNTPFSCGCTYKDAPVAIFEAVVRWRSGAKGEQNKKMLFTDGDYNSPIITDVIPEVIPSGEELVSGTLWMTVSRAEHYTPDSPMVTYECELLALQGTSLSDSTSVFYISSIDISVVEPAKILSINSTSETGLLNEGDNVTLECMASGLPRPDITWSRADDSVLYHTVDGGLQYAGNTLSLTGVTRNAIATYVCSASNRVTDVAPTDAISIDVLYRPMVKVHSIVVYQMVGYHTQLKCTVEHSNPSPYAGLWYYKPADNSNGYVAYSEDPRLVVANLTEDSTRHLFSTLTIESVTKDDYNRLYCCSIENSVGHTERCFSVKESDKPEVVNGEQPRKGSVTDTASSLSSHVLLVSLLCFLTISFITL